MFKNTILRFILLCSATLFINVSISDEIQLLQTVNTTSPRNTLKSFIDSINIAYTESVAIQKSYMRSSNLFLTVQEEKNLKAQQSRINYAKRTLNLSELPNALAQKIAMDKVLELYEILSRIELPDFKTIPGLIEMEAREFKNWTIPNTDITISRVEKGARAGEYLFSPETVEQLSEFYQVIKNAPYKNDAIPGIYDAYHYGTAGLRNIIPYKWIINLPDWLTFIILDQPIWRWIGIILLLLIVIMTVFLIHRWAIRWSSKNSDNQIRKIWANLAWPASLLFLIPFIVHVLEVNLRISEILFGPITITLWTLFTISLTWIVWSSGNLIAEKIVHSKNLLKGGIDSQLIRLGLRLISFILAIAVVVVGSQKLGLPAYSIITGLGVGGVAVAFAAKDSVANLLGSLVIMFEKPFRVGHWVKAGDAEGTVESVGFRSTRIRTFYNSVMSIPSDKLINTVVDNMGMRNLRRVRSTFYIQYSTDPQKVEKFITGLNAIINDSDFTSEDNIQIAFRGFATYGLEILLSFFLTVSDINSELRERQNIMIAILKLADTMQIEFAIPANLNETA
ncbi:MAG: mechanosensitive ion channel family protein [Gammaproteobacteria bacterium]